MILTAAKVAEAAGVLEVELTGLTSKILSDAYRKKAKSCHPDHHGEKELQLWARVSWAKECLTRHLERAPATPMPDEAPSGDECRACGGTGRVDVSKGYGRSLKMVCVMCKGSGELNPEQERYTAGD